MDAEWKVAKFATKASCIYRNKSFGIYIAYYALLRPDMKAANYYQTDATHYFLRCCYGYVLGPMTFTPYTNVTPL